MSWSARAFPITPFNIQRFVQIWLQQHPDKVAEWIPSDAGEKPELYIGGFFPIWEYSGWRDVTVSIGWCYLNTCYCLELFHRVLSFGFAFS